jgi:hypothetical protein
MSLQDNSFNHSLNKVIKWWISNKSKVLGLLLCIIIQFSGRDAENQKVPKLLQVASADVRNQNSIISSTSTKH